MGTPFIRLRPQTSATATLGLRYGPRSGGARKTQKNIRTLREGEDSEDLIEFTYKCDNRIGREISIEDMT